MVAVDVIVTGKFDPNTDPDPESLIRKDVTTLLLKCH